MKLRLRHNSIRFRLQKNEVQHLAAAGSVEEVIRFAPASALRYRLLARHGLSSIMAHYNDSSIDVEIPADKVTAWAKSEEVGFMAQQAVPGEDNLFILIEKDFYCLKPRTLGPPEDESDAYPNPNETCG